MKKSNANMALFMNMVKEKRSSEIPLLSKDNLFWVHIGPRTFTLPLSTFPEDTSGKPGASM